MKGDLDQGMRESLIGIQRGIQDQVKKD